MENWLPYLNANTLNDGATTYFNRGTGGFSTPDITAVSNAWSTETECTVNEGLGCGHLPIITIIRCLVPAASAFYRRVRWNTTNVYWHSWKQ